MDDKTKKVEVEKKKAEIMKKFDSNFDRIEEMVIESQEEKLREWVKGFSVGYASAIIGIAVAGFIIKTANSK